VVQDLGNLASVNPVAEIRHNRDADRNSIRSIAGLGFGDHPSRRMRIVSPYLFIAQYPARHRVDLAILRPP
jgi:hypothetical protein